MSGADSASCAPSFDRKTLAAAAGGDREGRWKPKFSQRIRGEASVFVDGLIDWAYKPLAPDREAAWAVVPLPVC